MELTTTAVFNAGLRRDLTDYDLHGLAGIRLLDASPRDIEAVTRQLGPLQASLNRPPEIVIRFVDRLAAAAPMRYLGVEEAAFTDDAFFVLRGKHKASVKVQIAFEQIGRQCEIVCERGLPAVPLLIPILNLTVLANGALPLHAAAFTYNGTGVLSTGWSKGGKTETLLAFMAQGAEYIGDEWVYLGADGQAMYGIPEPIRVWDWHLQYLPHYRARVSRGDRARLRTLRFLQSLDRWMPNGTGRRSLPIRALQRLLPLLKQQSFVDIHPQRLFGAGSGRLAGTVNKVLFVVSHARPDVTVEPIDPLEIARRMVFSLQHERLDFMAHYLKFRFAFPEHANELIERAEEIQRERLTGMLAGKEAYAVYHPYPVPIPALFDAIGPLL